MMIDFKSKIAPSSGFNVRNHAILTVLLYILCGLLNPESHKPLEAVLLIFRAGKGAGVEKIVYLVKQAGTGYWCLIRPKVLIICHTDRFAGLK
jgi:hypothetical protein